MLDPQVVDAVARGDFHIHTAERASEGMELLCGQAYGSLCDGGYPADTVLGRAQATLLAYRRQCQAMGPAGRGAPD